MPTIAPWLVPPNFLAAAESGARIGLEQANQAQQAAEAASRLGLGYAQLVSENTRAAASQKDADARLALERNRYMDLTRLAEGRLDQGDQRLDLTKAKDEAAASLNEKKFGLSTQRMNNLEDYRNQALDLARQKYYLTEGKTQAAEAKAQRESDAVAAVLADPEFASNPLGVIAKHPAATGNKVVNDQLNMMNRVEQQRLKPPPLAEITRPVGMTTVKLHVPQEQAIRAMGTNSPIKSGAAPAATTNSTAQGLRSLGTSLGTSSQKDAPGYTIGATYNNGAMQYLGGDINDTNSWKNLK